MALTFLPEEFLKIHKNEKWLLLDTRSPSEYKHARIPGAVNLPLLNDEHRKEVGTIYKQKGREAAVLKGFELVGPLFANFIKQVNELTDKKEILIYCWRGGMRSGIMAWVLGMAGYQANLLKGGYKAFRNWSLEQLRTPRNFLVLGGHTGAGKTEVLHHLKALGEQVIDLEGLANHKGSSFGALGQKPQPFYEQFENELAIGLWNTSNEKPVWIENESNSIGSVKIPDPLFAMIREAPIVEMMVERSVRTNRILSEYSSFPAENLAECTAKLQKRLGGLNTNEALQALTENRINDWVEILMDYYDKTYTHGLNERKQDNRTIIKMLPDESHVDFARRLVKSNNFVSNKAVEL